MGLSERDFGYVRRLVQERAAIVLEPSKTYLVESRLLPLAHQHGFSDVQELCAGLRADPASVLHRKVVEAMATNETSFFRDPPVFADLRDAVLPRLVARTGPGRPLRIWSAACASGQEQYSVAMLLCEHAPQLPADRLHLIASDLSLDVLARAREGRYTQLEVNRGLPATLLVKYFEQRGVDWYVKDTVRRMVEFRDLNLAEPWPPMPFVDLVLLRNVLIYFDVDTRRSVLEKVRRVLRPDGYLLLGSAETTLTLDERFDRAKFDRSIYFQLRGNQA
jgi:chemotaxis protein methyltransferase CheR